MQPRLPNASSRVELTHILIVGQGATVDAIKIELCWQGYQVDTLDSDKLTLLTTHKMHSDLVILDGRHSTLVSLDICRYLRQLSQVPIILLASTYELIDSNAGFEAGVDDCIYYPFEIEELLTRIRVRLRYVHKEKPPILQFDKLTLNCQKREVYWSNQEIRLTSKEFDLLKYLMVRYQQVVPRYELMEHLWGSKYNVSSNVVEAYICRLRFKLEQYSQERLIQTVYGVGYRLYYENRQD
ncbi:response regulator transcription factor [Cyanobacteria bacterium FACHB-471]|nr:response regulator transcription factor [Cyanobacteria bacterium FACHB-471]